MNLVQFDYILPSIDKYGPVPDYMQHISIIHTTQYQRQHLQHRKADDLQEIAAYLNSVLNIYP